MQFARAVEVYEQIEGTTKRLEMTGLLVGLLRDTPPEDLDKVVYLTQGRIHPDYLGVELGLAEKMVIRVLAHATGLDEGRVEKLWKEKGDLGLVAEQVIASRRLKPLESTPLTVAKVYANLDSIAQEGGEGSQERKIRLLSDLLSNATPREAKYILRMVVGKMRLGVADMTIVDALAATFATKADRDRVERAYNVSSDLGEVARVLASKGLKGLESVHLTLFRPIRAMLAERLATLDELQSRPLRVRPGTSTTPRRAPSAREARPWSRSSGRTPASGWRRSGSRIPARTPSSLSTARCRPDAKLSWRRRSSRRTTRGREGSN